MIDQSIIAGLGFKGAINNSYAQTMGQIYWGAELLDGTMINPGPAAYYANKRINEHNENPTFIPLIPDGGIGTIPDNAIKKAVFSTPLDLMVNTTTGSASTGERDIFEDNLGRVDSDFTTIRKSFSKKLAADADTIKKAMIAGTSSSTGSYLMHVIADEGVTYLYKRPYPIQALIPVEANKGRQALWDVIGPYEFGSAFFGTEDQSLSAESDITTHNRTDFVKYLFTIGRVTKAAQFAGLAQIPSRDMLAIRIDACQDALRALRERRMLGVTSDVSDTNFAFTNASATEYKGLYELVRTNTSGATGNQTWIASNGNTYKMIMNDLDVSYRYMMKFGMQPNLAVCDLRTFSTVRQGLMEYFRTEPIREFVQGVSKINLVFPAATGLPLVPHPFLPQAANYGAVFLTDTRLIARRALWQDTYEELAKMNLSQKFVVSAAETLIDKSDIGDDTHGGGVPAYSLHGGVFTIA